MRCLPKAAQAPAPQRSRVVGKSTHAGGAVQVPGAQVHADQSTRPAQRPSRFAPQPTPVTVTIMPLEHLGS